MYSDKAKPRRRLLWLLLAIVLAIRDAVQRSALQCYAVEGVYPPSLEYLQDNYGLQINTEDFYVTYDAFASNLPPAIRVTSRR